MERFLRQACVVFVPEINDPNHYRGHVQRHHTVDSRMMDFELEYENVLHVSFECQMFEPMQNTNNRCKHMSIKMALSQSEPMY